MTFQTNQPAYERLKKIIAERTRSPIVWTGAGVSAEQLPNWGVLRERLESALDRKKRSMSVGAEIISAAQVNLSNEKNPWKAFSLLQKILGDATWTSEIQDNLSTNDKPIPLIHELIWGLKPEGVLTLNLDDFSQRAWSKLRPGQPVTPFVGSNTRNFHWVLQGTQTYIGNLHGTRADKSSWVMTQESLDTLTGNTAYWTFLSSLFSAKLVIFIGISADDEALTHTLLKLKAQGVILDSHFWITDRTDLATDSWAESVGLQVIRYSSAGNHIELAECVKLLTKEISRDSYVENPTFVAIDSKNLTTDYTPEELIVLPDTDSIRRYLNLKAVEIIQSNKAEWRDQLAAFIGKYDEAIKRAWYATTKPGKNSFFGYELLDHAGHGAFGYVYKARRTEDDQIVAIKLLREEITHNNDQLMCFRRGIRSMQLLTDVPNLTGVVKYIAASEIPAFVAMEWVEGPTLELAVKNKSFTDWGDRLRVAKELAEKIHQVHSLPTSVLHRDLRPANIILRDFYELQHDASWEVVILDFDLSWHKGAQGVTMLSENSKIGYLAPEQLADSNSETRRRNAAVDSFGFGMTLYFLCTELEPQFNQHRSTDWEKNLHKTIAITKSSAWRSIPNRIARLIYLSTKDDQACRPYMGQIVEELGLLQIGLNAELVDDLPVEHLAEEIACRSDYFVSYSVDSQTRKITRNSSRTGFTVFIVADEPSRQLSMVIEWMQTGQEIFSNIQKYLVPKLAQVESELSKGGWKVVAADKSLRAAKFTATAEMTGPIEILNPLAKALDSAIGVLNFAG
jgi:eukaryotic-like serine/threonine-protein kinase